MYEFGLYKLDILKTRFYLTGMFVGSNIFKRKRGVCFFFERARTRQRSPQNAHDTMKPCREEHRTMTWQVDTLQNPGGVRGSQRQRLMCGGVSGRL